MTFYQNGNYGAEVAGEGGTFAVPAMSLDRTTGRRRHLAVWAIVVWFALAVFGLMLLTNDADAIEACQRHAHGFDTCHEAVVG